MKQESAGITKQKGIKPQLQTKQPQGMLDKLQARKNFYIMLQKKVDLINEQNQIK